MSSKDTKNNSEEAKNSENSDHENTYLNEKESEKLDEKAAIDVFGSEENAQKSGSIIKETFRSYFRKPREMSLKSWVEAELSKYPETFSKEDILKTSDEIIKNSQKVNETAANLDAELKNGGSEESFIAKNIEEGAKAANITNIGNYANQVQNALDEANKLSLATYLTKSGQINQNINLHGFIAEEHHVNSFNIDAITKNSSLRAEMCQSTDKNSVDILIKNIKTGKIVKRYQSKYGKEAAATDKYFKDETGNYKYKGQGKLVPKDQENEIKNANSTIKSGEVESKPLSYEDAQKAKAQAQKEQQIRDYDWDRVNKLDMSKHIAKQAGFAVALNSAMQGGFILGRRVFNFLSGKKNQTVSEDLKEWLNSTYEGGKNIAITTVATTGLTIAVRKGLISALAKNTPVGKIANIAYVGVCNVKTLYQMATGKMSVKSGFSEMRKTTVSTICSLTGSMKGATSGAAIGSVLGPVGAVAGGLVGGVVGGMAGSIVGETINKTYKKVKSFSKEVIKKSFDQVKNVVCTTANIVKKTCSSVVSAVKNVGSALWSGAKSFLGC